MKIYGLLVLLIPLSIIFGSVLVTILSNFIVRYGDSFVRIERRLNFMERTVVLLAFFLSLTTMIGILAYLYKFIRGVTPDA